MKIRIKMKIPSSMLSPKYLYALSGIIIIVVILVHGVFLYQNLYLSITQSEQIIVLKQKVAPDIINMEKFNTILEKLSKKINQEETDWKNIRNPFTPIVADILDISQTENIQEKNEPILADAENQNIPLQ